MSVKEAIKMLGYGSSYEIRGSYSGKTYHKSYINSSKNLDKYIDREVTETPFYTDIRMRGIEDNHWCIAVIVIWMHDYDICHKQEVSDGRN